MRQNRVKFPIFDTTRGVFIPDFYHECDLKNTFSLAVYYLLFIIEFLKVYK